MPVAISCLLKILSSCNTFGHKLDVTAPFMEPYYINRNVWNGLQNLVMDGTEIEIVTLERVLYSGLSTNLGLEV